MRPVEKSIVITGCSTGIGYACASILRDQGWRVFASCRKSEDCDRLRSEGFESPLIDYQRLDTVAAATSEILDATDGKLGAVFNNGAFAIPGAVEDLPTEALREIFEANFFGWHDLTRRLIPQFRANGCGRIVNCSSVLGFVPTKFRGAYVSTKYALEGLTDALRMELAHTDIGVSLIEPGPITSEFRNNAKAKFLHWVDHENSAQAERYRPLLERYNGPVEKDRFELGPEAVAKTLLHAVQSPRPKPRYFVTTPTWIAAAIRRFATTRMQDRILSRS